MQQATRGAYDFDHIVANTTGDKARFKVQPALLALCGVAGLIGAVAPTFLNIVASVIAEHDFVADTISDLGRGPHKWIMDTGFYISAAGLIALALASAHAHVGQIGWSMGLFCLALTSLVTVMLGLWDKFGGSGDMSVHTRLTFLLGPLYFLGPLLMAPALRHISRFTASLFVCSAILWLAFATAFKLAPDNVDGILEKTAVLATLLWTMPLSLLMLRLARS